MTDRPWLFTHAATAAQLPGADAPRRFAIADRHGTMLLGLYAPQGHDPQTPHEQDELYIVATGTAVIVKGTERQACAANDVIFVEAGITHRFEEMSDDFSAWVVFWGPAGGEADPAA